MLSLERGDTLVEVIVAFAILAAVAIGAIAAMNRGVAMTERSLEITLVREQLDAQAEILRYARDTQSTAWNDITSNTATSVGDSCPDAPPANAFIANVSSSGEVVYTRFSDAAWAFLQPQTHSRFAVSGSPAAHGMWVSPIRVAANAYDMHIRACWYAPGESTPMTLGTIVRLYET